MSGLRAVITSRRVDWLLAVLYASLLTYLLLTPHPLDFFGDSGRAAEDTIDRSVGAYLQHAIAYALFAAFLGRACRGSRPAAQQACFWAGVAHALAAEWLQRYVPDRYYHVDDVESNVLGFLIGWLAVMIVVRRGTGADRRPLEPDSTTMPGNG